MDLCIKTEFFGNDEQYPIGFNPCFNGSMYKNQSDQCPKTESYPCFNPCFNGSMYKNGIVTFFRISSSPVSILVLMDLCIKTDEMREHYGKPISFNPCFNGSMYKNRFSFGTLWS